MTDSPQIITYVSDDASEGQRWLAFYHGGKKHLPMYFAGPTRENVLERAQAFWAEQQAKLAREAELSTERSERLKRRHADAKAAP